MRPHVARFALGIELSTSAMSGTRSRMAPTACSIAAGGHDRKIALRRKEAADPLQDNRVPLRYEDPDCGACFPCLFLIPRAAVFIPALTSRRAESTANLFCQNVVSIRHGAHRQRMMATPL